MAEKRFLGEIVGDEGEFDYTLSRADTVFRLKRCGDVRQMTHGIEYGTAQQEKNPKRMVELMHQLIIDHCVHVADWKSDEPKIEGENDIKRVLSHLWPNDWGELVGAILNGKDEALSRFQKAMQDSEAKHKDTDTKN
jgi:hypothetical protein